MPSSPEHKKEYNRRYYVENRDNRVARIERRIARRRWLLEGIKRRRGCIDCGTKEGKLDFDHRPGEIKLFEPSRGIGTSMAKLKAEIAKCDVRCSSCHNRRHAAAGEIHTFQHSPLLSAERVEEIRYLHTTGSSYSQLATEFGIAKSTIGRIVRQETWAA